MKRIVLLIALATAVACRGEHVTGIYTLFWHSEKCHPEIFYVGNPPNATPECKWVAVLPPPPGVEIRWPQ
jgi:hypothetical protein